MPITRHWSIRWSLIYQIADLEGDVLIMAPLNPKIANTQLPLLLQMTHKKRLLTGHGMWVDRVRPMGWDTFIADNALLATLSAYEVGEGADQLLPISAKDIDDLKVHGMDLFVLDANCFLEPLMGLVPNLAKVYTQLFGQPIHRGEQLRVWSIDNWTGTTQIDLPVWKLSQTYAWKWTPQDARSCRRARCKMTQPRVLLWLIFSRSVSISLYTGRIGMG